MDGNGGWVYDKGSFHLYILPYMEQDTLFNRVAKFDLYAPRVDTITRAIYHDDAGKLVPFGSGVLPRTLPYHRCPSDSQKQYSFSSNYVGNGGIVDYSGSWASCGFDPFSPLYCDGSKIGHKWSCYGDENGMFRYVDNPTRRPLRMTSATDGTSNTLLLGEDLIDKHTYLNDNSDGPRGCWTMDSGFQLHTATIPINYPIVSSTKSPNFCTPDPAVNVFNLPTSAGYKSNHPGGANFGLLDGSVRFISDKINPITLIQLAVRDDGEPFLTDF